MVSSSEGFAMNDSSLFLVRVWHGGPGFHASVRRASDEQTRHFHRPQDVVAHLIENAPAAPTELEPATRGQAGHGHTTPEREE